MARSKVEEKDKRKITNISLSKTEKENLSKISEKVLGEDNRSGLIRFWIQQNLHLID